MSQRGRRQNMFDMMAHHPVVSNVVHAFPSYDLIDIVRIVRELVAQSRNAAAADATAPFIILVFVF